MRFLSANHSVGFAGAKIQTFSDLTKKIRLQKQKEVPVDLFFCGAGRTRGVPSARSTTAASSDNSLVQEVNLFPLCYFSRVRMYDSVE